MPESITRYELIGALLWLRNHYDEPNDSVKETVLAVVDRILNDENVGVEHVVAFRAFRIRKGMPNRVQG